MSLVNHSSKRTCNTVMNNLSPSCSLNAFFSFIKARRRSRMLFIYFIFIFFTALCAHHCIINQGSITSRPGPAGGAWGESFWTHADSDHLTGTFRGRSPWQIFIPRLVFPFHSLLFLFVLNLFFFFCGRFFRLCECTSEIKLVRLI